MPILCALKISSARWRISGLGRLLRGLVELLAPENMAGEHRDVAWTERRHERLHVDIEHVAQPAELQDGGRLGAVVGPLRHARPRQHRFGLVRLAGDQQRLGERGERPVILGVARQRFAPACRRSAAPFRRRSRSAPWWRR